MSIVSLCSNVLTSVVSVIQILNPSHVKDYVSKFTSKFFDHTFVYTDKNVELDGLKTTSIVTPDVLANVSELNSDDINFKASNEKTELITSQ